MDTSTPLTMYREVSSLEEAETNINILTQTENWYILVPPTPRMTEIKVPGGYIYMQTGIWYILHKFF